MNEIKIIKFIINHKMMKMRRQVGGDENILYDTTLIYSNLLSMLDA